jgi:thymidylate synthase (FAD)
MKIKMPIFVARQYFKSSIGFTRNEESRRSITDIPDFYLPYKLNCELIEEKQFLYNDIAMHYEKNINLYNKLLSNDVKPEQARIILPQSMYTTFIETGNL